MSETHPHGVEKKSEWFFTLGVVVALAAIAGFFYWWGGRDREFNQRKAALFFDQLSRVTDARKNQSGVELFVSYSKEADTTERLLDSDLDHDQWLKVAQQRAEAICKLVSMGDTARAPDLVALCDELAKYGDPRAVEIGQCAKCALDFETQYLVCKHKRLIAEMIELATDPASGEPGKVLADAILEHQETDWRMSKFTPTVQELAKALPRGNPLSRRLETFLGQLIDIEYAMDEGAKPQEFQEWLTNIQDLVSQYPTNTEVCQAILDRHDRLTQLDCFDEAKQLLEVAITAYSDTVPPDSQNGAEFVDRRSASEIELDQWKSRVRDNPAESESVVQPIVDGAKDLEQRQLNSPGIVERFIDVADLMEQSQQYESLSKFRDQLAVVFAKNGSAAARFESYCAASSKRAALVGKPFSLPSAIAAGRTIDPAIFHERATAVVFWSSTDPASIDMVSQLDHLFMRHKERGFGLIGINVDVDLDAVRAQVDQQVEWTLVIAAGLDGTGNNPLAVEYGIETTPYLILVDSDGNVVDVALSVHDMWERAGKVMPSLVVRRR
jgi:hypothetical protein